MISVPHNFADRVDDPDPARKARLVNFFVALNQFMSARHGYKRFKCDPWTNKVDAKCNRFKLTLAYCHNNAVEISNIRFLKKRCGHGQALIEFLDSVSHNYKIIYVEFISVSTEPMYNFVQKMGFTKREASYSLIETGTSLSNWYRLTPYGLALEK